MFVKIFFIEMETSFCQGVVVAQCIVYWSADVSLFKCFFAVLAEVVAAEKPSTTQEPENERSSFLSTRLRRQLKNKRMLISKNDIELSNAIGQGACVLLRSCVVCILLLMILLHRSVWTGLQGVSDNCERKRTGCSQNC